MAKAFENVWKSITGMPTGQLTRYRLVKVVSTPAGAVGPGISHSVAGENAIGVVQEPNKAGEPTQVVVAGISFVELGGAVTDGARVMSNASGQIIPYVEATDPASNVCVGTAMVGGTTAGDIGSILLG